ncbi:hypothetical protein [Rhodovulum strictum]|uniref:Arginine transporter n=1 Tax=Rhodovulum strictum TaxID=58314 RepID=A0A844B510_9RHOB|nr:hypothetical protein [Rhodovulum strictum]MRH21456.1 hypothetical protein [Rhodovulum strictum]
MRVFALAAVVAAFSTPALAGPIERACLGSDRPGVSRGVCGCIQQAANVTLSASDQRQAAKFFRDPHQAQVVRQSKSDRDSQFWQRYKRFGATAEAYCG